MIILIGVLLLVLGQLTYVNLVGGPGFVVPDDLPSLGLTIAGELVIIFEFLSLYFSTRTATWRSVSILAVLLLVLLSAFLVFLYSLPRDKFVWPF